MTEKIYITLNVIQYGWHIFFYKDDKSKIGDEESWAALVFEKCSRVYPHVAYRCRRQVMHAPVRVNLRGVCFRFYHYFISFY
jgi:hypothetical protein